jgi:hypothetical protein
MISPGDLKVLIVRAFLETGKDQTVPELAKRAGVSETTIRKALGACPGGCPDGCRGALTHYETRPSRRYGPTRGALRELLLEAQEELDARCEKKPTGPEGA